MDVKIGALKIRALLIWRQKQNCCDDVLAPIFSYCIEFANGMSQKVLNMIWWPIFQLPFYSLRPNTNTINN
jgi:hypothetical protein